MNPEHGKQAERCANGSDTFGVVELGDGSGLSVPEGNVGERPRVLAVGDVVGEAGVEILDVDAGRSLPDADETVRLGEMAGV